MECCVLCLEINKDILESIRVSSSCWHELNIIKIIEKHFWSLNTIMPWSWICLSCWQEVNRFHKFYLRIEEAHANFGKLELKDSVPLLKCKEELPMQKTNTDDSDILSCKDNITCCFQEPEILIDQSQQMEQKIMSNTSQSNILIADNETATSEPLDELNLNNLPVKQKCKQMRLNTKTLTKDPLRKSNISRMNKNSKTKLLAEETPVQENNVKKEELVILSDKKSDSPRSYTEVIYLSSKDSNSSAERKRRLRMEHDEFIQKHFKRMICDLCQVPLEDFQAIQKHFTETHKQRGYVICCKRKFFDRTRLVDHLHCHLNPDHFKCKECGKAMSDRIRLVNHMLRVHRANEVVKQHSCDVCGKSFREAYVLRTHKLTHLPEEEKKFHCTDCGKNYGSSYLLNQHKQVVHLKRFVKICYICGKAINTSAEFKAHMNKHEGIPAPVINCDICSLRLTSLRSLKLHKETQHPAGGKQQHHCALCDKISPTARALKKHINTMHEKGFDHKCTICQKAFRRAETLKEHMASHTGTTLYTCPWCPKTFNSNGNMHAHRKNKHPKEYLELKMQRYN